MGSVTHMDLSFATRLMLCRMRVHGVGHPHGPIIRDSFDAMRTCVLATSVALQMVTKGGLCSKRKRHVMICHTNAASRRPSARTDPRRV